MAWPEKWLALPYLRQHSGGGIGAAAAALRPHPATPNALELLHRKILLQLLRPPDCCASTSARPLRPVYTKGGCPLAQAKAERLDLLYINCIGSSSIYSSYIYSLW